MGEAEERFPCCWHAGEMDWVAFQEVWEGSWHCWQLEYWRQLMEQVCFAFDPVLAVVTAETQAVAVAFVVAAVDY